MNSIASGRSTSGFTTHGMARADNGWVGGCAVLQQAGVASGISGSKKGAGGIHRRASV